MSELGLRQLKVDDVVEAEIFKVTSFGAFARLPNGQRAMIHISQLGDDFVEDIGKYVKIGDRIKARILSINGKKIDLTLKRPKDEISSYPNGKEFKASPWEDKLDSFLKRKQ